MENAFRFAGTGLLKIDPARWDCCRLLTINYPGFSEIYPLSVSNVAVIEFEIPHQLLLPHLIWQFC